MTVSRTLTKLIELQIVTSEFEFDDEYLHFEFLESVSLSTILCRQEVLCVFLPVKKKIQSNISWAVETDGLTSLETLKWDLKKKIRKMLVNWICRLVLISVKFSKMLNLSVNSSPSVNVMTIDLIIIDLIINHACRTEQYRDGITSRSYLTNVKK